MVEDDLEVRIIYYFSIVEVKRHMITLKLQRGWRVVNIFCKYAPQVGLWELNEKTRYDCVHDLVEVPADQHFYIGMTSVVTLEGGGETWVLRHSLEFWL